MCFCFSTRFPSLFENLIGKLTLYYHLCCSHWLDGGYWKLCDFDLSSLNVCWRQISLQRLSHWVFPEDLKFHTYFFSIRGNQTVICLKVSQSKKKKSQTDQTDILATENEKQTPNLIDLQETSNVLYYSSFYCYVSSLKHLMLPVPTLHC